MVDAALDAECLVVDEMDSEAADACIGACARNLVLAVFFELEGARCLPRGGVACWGISGGWCGGSGRSHR